MKPARNFSMAEMQASPHVSLGAGWPSLLERPAGLDHADLRPMPQEMIGAIMSARWSPTSRTDVVGICAEFPAMSALASELTSGIVISLRSHFLAPGT